MIEIICPACQRHFNLTIDQVLENPAILCVCDYKGNYLFAPAPGTEFDGFFVSRNPISNSGESHELDAK